MTYCNFEVLVLIISIIFINNVHYLMLNIFMLYLLLYFLLCTLINMYIMFCHMSIIKGNFARVINSFANSINFYKYQNTDRLKFLNFISIYSWSLIEFDISDVLTWKFTTNFLKVFFTVVKKFTWLLIFFFFL